MANKRFLCRLVCFLLLALWPCGDLFANNIRLLGDWSYLGSSIETKYRDGSPKDETETVRYKQNYRLDLSKELFPNLSFDAGAQMENSRQFNDINNDENNSQYTSVQPYLEAELRTSLYSLSAGYRERSEKSKGTDTDTKRNYIDSYNLRGEWRPVELPRFDLSYQHTKRYDKPFEQRNETGILQFNSRYDYENYEFQYGYFRNEDTIIDALGDKVGAVTNTHNSRVRYSNSYRNGLVSLNASIRGEYSDQTFSGSSTRDFPVDPSGSSFIAEDAQSDPTLSGNFVPFSNQNLDLTNNQVINIGLDFIGEAVAVDMLQITLDAKVETNANITDSGNWSVYVSNDQLSWTLWGLPAIEYFQEENFIKIRFTPRTDHKYILLVYDPINIVQNDPVHIASIRAFASEFISDGSQLESHAVNAQMGVGWQMTDKTRALYDLNLQERQSSLFNDQRIRMNNSLTVLHRINKVFSTIGRVSADDSWEQSQHDTSRYNYSAKLTARYLETLRQALIYSGGFNQEPEGDSTTNSLLLHTNAELYRGWDVSFDQGYSWQNPAVGADSSSFFVRIENKLVPHRRLTLTTDYAITWDKETGAELFRSDSGRLRVSWIPSDTLSLQGEIQLRKTEVETEVFWEYGASWLPFRDGTLQCNLNFSEEEDADGNRTRSFSPNITWDLTEYANLSLRYSQGTEETNTKIDEFQTFLISLRIYYD